MAKILQFPTIGEMSVNEVLENAKADNLEKVLIIGWDGDGDVSIDCCKMTKENAIWLCHVAMKYIMEDV